MKVGQKHWILGKFETDKEVSYALVIIATANDVVLKAAIMYDRATYYLRDANYSKKKRKVAFNLTLEEHGVCVCVLFVVK